MTILFQSDWDKYPSAIMDYETPNQEFVKLASLYREMGVENYGFILSLKDPGLQGIDPYNPPNKEMARRVAIECKNNFWYFIREIARDPQGSNEFPIRFKPNRGIIAAYWLYLNHILYVLIMIRQTGKSFGIDWLITWLMNFGLTKSEISHITKDEKLRSRELERLKSMELTMPAYLKFRSNRDPGNTEMLKISALENIFRSNLPNRSEKLADLVGRGMTSANVFGDEIAYLVNNFITIPVMLSASQAARQISRLKNEPYGTVFTTTSGKRNTPEGQYAYKLVNNAAQMNEKFFDSLDLVDLEDIIIKASPGNNLHVNCTYNHRQLGYDDNWLRDRLKESLLTDATDEDTRIQVEADYLNLWPAGSELTPFPQDVASRIQNSEVPERCNIISDENYTFRWHYDEAAIPKRLKEKHFFCIDSSEAIGRDSIGNVLINIETGETAMVCNIPKTNIIVFCLWLVKFIKENTEVTLIIERRSTGGAILDYLLHVLPGEGIDPFKRIYNKVVQEAAEYPERFKEIQNIRTATGDLYLKYKDTFGWATSGSGATSRSKLYTETLINAGRHIGHVMKDRELILQVLGLVVVNGRVDHRDGAHDDLVIAWLLGYWLMTLGRNLYYYGVDPSMILYRNTVIIKQKEIAKGYEYYVQQRAKADVTRLTKELENENDPIVIKQLEFELEYALKNLSEHDRTIISADDFINKLREKRRSLRSTSLVEKEYGHYGNSGYLSYEDRNNWGEGVQVYLN